MIPISFLVGPAVGAAIGYLTNALAVKMLFRPYTEKRIGGLRLPFTPGVIPRRRRALAKALGDAVGKRLVTRQDLSAALLSSESLDALTDRILEGSLKEDGTSLSLRLNALLGEEKSLCTRERINGAIAKALVLALSSANLGEILLREGSAALRAANPMLGMFLGDAVLEQLSPAVESSIKRYLFERGEKDLLATVTEQSEAWLRKSPSLLLSELGLDGTAERALLRGAIERLVDFCLPTLVEGIDLSRIVERKIEGMDIRELESLILSVMRRELRAVVSLGAVIGLFLGFLTAVF